MATDTSVSWTPDQFLSSELNLDPNVSRNLVELFENGNEVAFIARYRRHLTNNISSDQLRYALEAFNTAKTLKTKAEKLIKRAETEIEDVHQKNEIKAALSRTMDSYELDSIFQPFKKTKKGTLASRAMELGVGDVAEQIFQGKRVDLKRYITENPALNSYDKVEMEVSNVLSERLHRMEETQSFIRKICELENYCGLRMEVTSSLSKKAKALKEGDKDFQLIDHFKLYISFSKEARYVLPYQVLALERAASLGIITWKIKVDERIATYHPGLRLDFHPSHCVLLKKIVTDSTKRFLIPNIERNIKRRLSAAAERSAIDCFAKNVRQLMLTAPLKGYEVLAIDPGYSNGCKCALVDENGNVLSTDVFYLRLDRGRNVWCMDHHAEKLVKTLVTKSSHRRIVIAIGNGTASQPTQQAIASLIRRNVFSPVEAKFCVVSESGASIYSVTPLAESELPGMDPNLRSAVSLARRIIDPISEYVKIAPKHLGVGSYQVQLSVVSSLFFVCNLLFMVKSHYIIPSI
ncbi:hypothetical protein AB6A40_006711 [Gnathostoma spinigerum]|uniref:YqgF/RNase H-like domain-containing protein n=1 Tax=Gnathostoma spinigerum TaxID=75299 RepID=A0ABD6ETX6_9BILA